MGENGKTAFGIADPVSERSRAFGAAILTASPALKQFALRVTADHAAAEDLVQDTLTRAWAARARFEAGTNIKAWLFRIARNAFLSGARRTRRLVAWDPDRHQLMLVQSATQDDALYTRDLDAALSRLPSVLQTAFLLIVREGMSIAHAADELGVPIGTVKSRVYRARTSVLAYVMGKPTTDDEGPPSRPARRGHIATASSGSDYFSPTDQAALSRYRRWQSSGATMIG